MEEIWKDIGIKKYQVSNLGNVKGQDGLRLLKTKKHLAGYTFITLCDGNTQKHKTIHSLVMETFVGVRPIGMDIDHINRIRDDNRLENLRYITHADNQKNMKTYDNTILETDRKKRQNILKQKSRLKKKQDEIIIE